MWNISVLSLLCPQLTMVRSMLSLSPSERPEAVEITGTPIFQDLELPCQLAVRQRSRTYSSSSMGRPTRQTSNNWRWWELFFCYHTRTNKHIEELSKCKPWSYWYWLIHIILSKFNHRWKKNDGIGRCCVAFRTRIWAADGSSKVIILFSLIKWQTLLRPVLSLSVILWLVLNLGHQTISEETARRGLWSLIIFSTSKRSWWQLQAPTGVPDTGDAWCENQKYYLLGFFFLTVFFLKETKNVDLIWIDPSPQQLLGESCYFFLFFIFFVCIRWFWSRCKVWDVLAAGLSRTFDKSSSFWNTCYFLYINERTNNVNIFNHKEGNNDDQSCTLGNEGAGACKWPFHETTVGRWDKIIVWKTSTTNHFQEMNSSFLQCREISLEIIQMSSSDTTVLRPLVGSWTWCRSCDPDSSLVFSWEGEKHDLIEMN